MKILTIIFLSLVMSNFSASEEINYQHDISALHWEDKLQGLSSRYFILNYDTEDNEFIIYTEDYNKHLTRAAIIGFTLSRKQADAFIEAINKFKRWNIKASKMEVKLEKQISRLTAKSSFWREKDWHFGYELEFQALFISKDIKTHYITFTIPELVDSSAENEKYTPNWLSFNYDEAKKLAHNLSEKEITSFLLKWRDSKTKKSERNTWIEDQFD